MADFNFDVVIGAPYRDTVAHFTAALANDVQPGVKSTVTKTGRNTFVEVETEAETQEIVAMMTGATGAELDAQSSMTTAYTLSAVPGGTRVQATGTISDTLAMLAQMGSQLVGEPNPFSPAELQKSGDAWAQRITREVKIQKNMADRAKGGLE